MFKKITLFLTLFLLSCSANKNLKTLANLVAREEYMKNEDPSRIFNPASAVVIATLPNRVGDFKSYGKIKDFEIIKNGAGYSKTYKSSIFGKKFLAEIYAYHYAQANIANDMNNNAVKQFYKALKSSTLRLYGESKLISENSIIFTTPTSNSIAMKKFSFEYQDNDVNTTMINDVFFGTTLGASFYKIKFSYPKNINNDELQNQEMEFVKDIAYYFAEGVSLNDFEKIKKNWSKNPVKVEKY